MRKETETLLKGNDDQILPSSYLSEGAKHYFYEVVEHYAASKILSNVDVSVIERYAKARDSLDYIDMAIAREPDKALDKDIVNMREKWEKALNKATIELGLSPQSRAKLGNINQKKKAEEGDPLLNALKRVK